MTGHSTFTWLDKATIALTTGLLFLLGLFAGLLGLALGGAVVVAAAFKRWRFRHNGQGSHTIEGECRRVDVSEPS